MCQFTKAFLKLLQDFSNETDVRKKADYGPIIIRYLEHEYGKKNINIFLKKLESVAKDDYHFDMNFLGNIYDGIGYSAKAIHFYEEAIRLSKSYKYKNNLATLHSQLNNFEDSIKLYKSIDLSAIKDKDHKSNILYNYGLTLNLTGKYQEAKSVTKKLTKVYESFTETEKQSDKNFWINYGDHSIYNTQEFEKAVEVLEEGLIQAQDEIEIKILVSLILACSKIIENCNDTQNNIKIINRNKIRKYSLRARNLIEKNKYDEEYLAEVAFNSKEFSLALNHYKNISKAGTNLKSGQKGDINYFLGMCHFYLEDYDKATKELESSAEINPVPFILNQLANSYRLQKRYYEAEVIYDRLSKLTSSNTGTLYGRFLLHIDKADSIADINKQGAFLEYSRALSIATKLLSESNHEDYSRSLNFNETSEVQYLIGYVNIQLSNISSRSNQVEYLNSAHKSFNKIKKVSSLYSKAELAKDMISEQKRSENNYEIGVKKTLLISGFLVAFLAITAIIIGNIPIVSKYKVDSQLLAKQLNMNEEDVNKVYDGKIFDSEAELISYVSLYYKNELKDHGDITIKSIKEYRVFGGEGTIDNSIIILLISISFVFIILGFLFDRIKTIKIGNIALERSDAELVKQQIEISILK